MNRRSTLRHRELSACSASELAGAARGGDELAVGELYRRTRRPARAAARRVGGEADVDDAVAEGFFRALARLDRLVDPAAVESYIIRCVVRVAIDLARQRRRQPATGSADLEALSELVLPAAESAADRALSAIERHAVAGALNRLDPGPRLLLLLRYEAGLSVRHIASVLGRPDGTVRRQCAEARRMAGQQFLGQHLRPASGDCARAAVALCQVPYRRPSGLAGRRLSEHLRACPACRDRQQELTAIVKELGLRSVGRQAG